MSKTLRNTLFTITAVALTALGVSWNKQIIRKHDPLLISQQVLASPVATTKTGLPLEIAFTRSAVKLGEYQELTVKTAPFAKLAVVTVYPNGRADNPQTKTAKADELGVYRLRYRINDWRLLGVVKTTVKAELGGKTATFKSSFVLREASARTSPASSEPYLYQLLP